MFKHDDGAVKDALDRLFEWFLIEHDNDLMYLHGFIAAYFADSLRNDRKSRDRIAEKYGRYALARVSDYQQKFESIAFDPDQQNNTGELASLSGQVFRYALPADRLLRSVGLDKLADELPIRTKGTLRGMVYYFYQEAQDYRKALEYAEHWLILDPNDSEVLLYRIRCYRKFGNQESFKKAIRLIDEMETGDHSTQTRIRLKRERALIALRQGNSELAKECFNEGIQMDRKTGNQPYSEIYAGLARVYIAEAEESPEWDTETVRIATNAVKLLEVAKREDENFVRFHMDAYVEALILAGQDQYAMPVLESALRANPKEPRLNFRMAELLRKSGELERAVYYAEAGHKNGHVPSLITHANILYDQGVQANQPWNKQKANKYFDDALKKLDEYVRDFSTSRSDTELEVVDTIRCKIYRAQDKLGQAKSTVHKEKYSKTNNPYTVYEQVMISIAIAEAEMTKGNYISALVESKEAVERLDGYSRRHNLPVPLAELRERANQQNERIRRSLEAK